MGKYQGPWIEKRCMECSETFRIKPLIERYRKIKTDYCSNKCRVYAGMRKIRGDTGNILLESEPFENIPVNIPENIPASPIMADDRLVRITVRIPVHLLAEYKRRIAIRGETIEENVANHMLGICAGC